MSFDSRHSYPLIAHHSNTGITQQWQRQYQGQRPCYICVLGFTETALVADISAAGNSPQARMMTAVADAEFIYAGPSSAPQYPLPPLTAGVSPALLARAVITGQAVPVYLFNAGLPHSLSVPHIDLGGGTIARCVSSGQALSPDTVRTLFNTGLKWGEILGRRFAHSYLIIGECVVAGTTTAQAVLTALGFNVAGLMGSSHLTCNHEQKTALIKTGLMAQLLNSKPWSVWDAIAAVGDPMQPFVLGMTIAASHHSGVLLAGGSQMIAIYTMLQKLGHQYPWNLNNVVIGTTQWIVKDATSKFLTLAHTVPTPPIMSSQFSFKQSRYQQFNLFEQGYVKEGVGAGGCLIAGHLYQSWQQAQTLNAMEALLESCLQISAPPPTAQ
ncbi:TIGR00303 family protein [Leptolyngbya sp. PCC 7375]|nr:TIGR00303 family protein [Leptolyngbya sp. PCC 7375]